MERLPLKAFTSVIMVSVHWEVAFLKNATIEYLLEFFCVCVCVPASTNSTLGTV